MEEEEPNTHDKVNETMDAGTQTIVHEDLPMRRTDDEMGGALDYKKVGGTMTQAITPRNRVNNFSTKRNSVEGEPGLIKDSSLDRLDVEAMSLNPYQQADAERDHQKNINITN